MLKALRQVLGGRIGTEHRASDLADWMPVPSGVDIVIMDSRESSVRVGIELKSYKLDETLWDIIKMASLRRMTGVEAAYVVVAATSKKFDGSGDCAALFQTRLGEATSWESSSWFDRWPTAWADLLRGGSARPSRMSSTVSLELISRHKLTATAKWEIRALRVENPEEQDWIKFDSSGWPHSRLVDG